MDVLIVISIFIISGSLIYAVKKIEVMQKEIDYLHHMSDCYYEDIGKIEKELRDNKKMKQKEDKKRKRDKLK